jgi:superfamily II DNA or RNA helicase
MIEVGRNSIVVRNVDQKSPEYKKANFTYSLYDKVYHKYTFNAYTLIDNDMYFPASITVPAIQACFPKDDVIINYKTTAPAAVINYNMKHYPRNLLQKKALEFLMKIKTDNDQRERFLSLATGSGKTYITINFISQMKLRAMIVVDALDLADQWKREFLNHTDLKDEDIAILSGQDIVDAELKDPKRKIYIAIHRTLGNMLTSDANSVNMLMNKLKIGIRVFDESHVDFGNICKINALSNVEYTIYLTATPSRSNFNDNSLYGKIFKNIPYFNGRDIEDEKYHTVVLYPMNTHPDIDTQASVRTKYGFSAALWAQYIMNGGYDYFLQTIEDIITKFNLIERKKKVAIMLPTIELIKKLKQDLLKNHPDMNIGTFIGEIKKEDRLAELSKQFILTNDKIFDKAIDVEDLEILINFVPLGSLVKTEQIMGRIRNGPNKVCLLIDITDYGFQECIREFKIRKRFYKKKAKKIIEIEKKDY